MADQMDAVDVSRMSIVKQRRAEFEMMQPFCEARDLMLASLSDPKDRDRSKLASLFGEKAPVISRARTASEQMAQSELKLPTNVLRDFMAACDACERVLKDRASGEQQQRRAQWLEQMKRAAETYIEKVEAPQKTQGDVEATTVRAASSSATLEEGNHGDESEDEGSTVAPGSIVSEDGAPLEELAMLDEEEASELGLQMLEDFLGESAPSFVEAFGKPGAENAEKAKKKQGLWQALRLLRKEKGAAEPRKVGRAGRNKKQADKSADEMRASMNHLTDTVNQLTKKSVK